MCTQSKNSRTGTRTGVRVETGNPPFALTESAGGAGSEQERTRAELHRDCGSQPVVCPPGGGQLASGPGDCESGQSQLVTSALNASTSGSRSLTGGSDTGPERYTPGTPPVHPGRTYAGADVRQETLEVLWAESSRPRQRNCRRAPVGGVATVDLYRSDRGTYLRNVQTCGHVTCPVCGPRIRETERSRIRQLVAAHLDAGGSVYTFLLTLSHGPLDAPEDLMDALDAGRAAAIGSKGGSRWAKDRRDYGVEGTSWTRETMYGLNGWHPHVHGLLFTDRELSDSELASLQSRVYGRYSDELAKRGRRADPRWNQIEPVHSPDAIADYVTKGDQMASRIAAEMARGDLKQGKGLTPEAILYRFTLTGDVADLDTFRQYEQAMDGRRWRYLSPALAKRYGVTADGAEEGETGDAQDAQDAQDEVGGTLALRVPLVAWRVLTRTQGAISALRWRVHEGHLDAARAMVAAAMLEASRKAPDRPHVGSVFGAGGMPAAHRLPDGARRG